MSESEDHIRKQKRTKKVSKVAKEPQEEGPIESEKPSLEETPENNLEEEAEPKEPKKSISDKKKPDTPLEVKLKKRAPVQKPKEEPQTIPINLKSHVFEAKPCNEEVITVTVVSRFWRTKFVIVNLFLFRRKSQQM